MIYLTGDIHGDIDIRKLSNSKLMKSFSLTSEDYLIICGDFGFPFYPTDYTEQTNGGENERSSRRTYHYWMKWMSDKPYTILWIDGNHDNHPFWYDQPAVEWNGGLVNIHPLADNVIHLKRGEYYTIEGHTFWTMGGAQSHDRMLRTTGISWWEEEIPSVSEMNYGFDKLLAHDNKVDFIVTHTLPQSVQLAVTDYTYPEEPTSRYLDEIFRRVDFKYWFCGHFHTDFDNRELRVRALYDDIVCIEKYLN